MRSGAQLTAIGLALCVAGCATRGSAPPTNPTAALPLISYCELVHEPVRYLGKKVRVVGVFRVGFEWEELYSTRCPDAYTTWVENGLEECAPHVVTREEQKRDEAESKVPLEFQGATYGVIVRGTLYGGDGKGYGHLNAYTFVLVPDCAEDLEWLDERSYVEHALTADMRKKIDRYLRRHEPTGGDVR